MAILALGCLAFGIVPWIILAPLEATVFDLIGTHAEIKFDLTALVVNRDFGWLAPLWLALGLLAVLAMMPLALHLIGATSRRRYYETWGCGRALQTARFEYTATAFANPFKRVFAVLYRPVKDVDVEFHPESRYFIRTIEYGNESRLIFEDALYRPLLRAIESLARRARVLQSGNVHSYLVYILIPLVALLLLTV